MRQLLGRRARTTALGSTLDHSRRLSLFGPSRHGALA